MSNPSDTGSVSILLIEDDDVDIEIVIRKFRDLDVPAFFHVAKTGIEALEMLYGSDNREKITPPPDAIILDTNMPQMDGIEFLEKLHAHSGQLGMPVFMLTGEYTTRDKLAVHNLTVTARIVKPLCDDDVLRIYSQAAGKSRR